MPIMVASDVIVQNKGKILIEKRGSEPFKGLFCLPGGRWEEGERIEETAKREVKEEAGIDIEIKDILGVYSDPKRDPRGHTLTVVFIADAENEEIKAGSDAAEVFWIEPEKLELDEMAFDHGRIIKDYIEWLDKKETFWSSKG
ncbi:MAG: NUDIX hydrolase [Candidatus Aenigmarchaeota archaeon]|nr:NUDIX hydrolase [Candidatus Aenigmarchaeota archaeon]